MNEDKTVVERGCDKKKHCGLCGDTGHHQYNCRRLKADFGGVPLPNKNRTVRDTLAKNLVCSVSLPGFPIFTRQIDDDRLVLNEEHTFRDVFSKISKFLRCILLSHTVDEWDETYISASAILEFMH